MMRDNWRVGAVAASATVVAAGVGTSAAAETLGHAGLGVAASIGGVAAVAATGGIAAAVLASRNFFSNGRAKTYIEQWPDESAASSSQRLPLFEANSIAANLPDYVSSLWCESSRSLLNASELLTTLPLPHKSALAFGRARVDRRGQVSWREHFPDSSQYMSSARESANCEWVEIRASATASEPSVSNPWTQLVGPTDDTNDRNIQLRFMVLAIRQYPLESTIVGVVSPLPSLTEAIFQLIREGFDAVQALPRFRVQNLKTPTIRVRSARFSTPYAEVLERYRIAAGFFERLPIRTEGNLELQGVTLGMGM